MELREAVDDTRGVVSVLHAVFPEIVVTEESIRHRRATTPAWVRPLYLEALFDGVVVGTGSAMLDHYSKAQTDALVGVQVLPRYRGHGVGTALWQRLDEHLAEIGARTVRSYQAVDEPTTTSFAERRGFRRTSTSTVLACVPAGIEPPALPPDTAARPFAEFADDATGVYEVEAKAMQDEPGDHDFDGMTYEGWLAFTFEAPHFDPQLSQVLVIEGAPVGTTLVFSDRSTGRAANGGTGILRSHRGRGFGLALKRASLSRAAALGIGRVFTQNDDTNAPMLAINRRLGYEPFAARGAWRADRHPG